MKDLRKQFENEKGYLWDCNDIVRMEYIEWLEQRMSDGFIIKIRSFPIEELEELRDMCVSSITSKTQMGEVLKNSSTSVNDKLHEELNATKDFPEHGEVMTMEDFVSYCKTGQLIDHDGFARLALKDKMNGDLHLTPSMAIKGLYDKRYTHVVWFNK